MAYNRLQTMRNNIEAIRVAFRLGVEKRPPTADEREALGRYAGFGGLKCILNDANELTDAAKWSKSDIELFAPTVELRRLIHDYSKSDKGVCRLYGLTESVGVDSVLHSVAGNWCHC